MPIGAHLWNQWQAKMSLGTRDKWYGRITSVCIFTAAGTQTDSSWFLFEQERKLREQEIHLACFEIRGESLLSFYASKIKMKFSLGVLQRELVSAQQQLSVETSRLYCYSFPLCLAVTLKLWLQEDGAEGVSVHCRPLWCSGCPARVWRDCVVTFSSVPSSWKWGHVVGKSSSLTWERKQL